MTTTTERTWRDEARDIHMLYRILELNHTIPIVDAEPGVTEACEVLKARGLTEVNDDGDWTVTDAGIQLRDRMTAVFDRVDNLRVFESVDEFDTPFDDDRDYDPNFGDGTQNPSDLRVAMYKHIAPRAPVERFVFLVNLVNGDYDKQPVIGAAVFSDIDAIVAEATEVPPEYTQMVWDAGMLDLKKARGPACNACGAPLALVADREALHGYTPCDANECPLAHKDEPDDPAVDQDHVEDIIVYEETTYGSDPYDDRFYGLLALAIIF